MISQIVPGKPGTTNPIIPITRNMMPSDIRAIFFKVLSIGGGDMIVDIFE